MHLVAHTQDLDSLWRAVLARDARLDGLFVYAVRSTGIYCRPSCPSRRPRLDRVAFFPDAATAEASGYRACRRCRPEVAREAVSDAAARVGRVCQRVAARPAAAWTAERLARAGGLSVPRLQRAFRALLGVSPLEYVRACRRRQFLADLRRGRTVTEATYQAGFGSTSRMYGALRLPGMRPATYGRGGQGASIEWTTTTSPLGAILVAATAAGLCFVEVGASVETLVAQLRREFPRAAIARAPSARLDALAEAALAIASGHDVRQEVPVDIQGTAFQWRVWRALTEIPRGETRTYAGLAAAIGAPSSVRAVARACARNPLALVVPCHRVVGSDGKLRGFRWGLEVKRALIDVERAAE